MPDDSANCSVPSWCKYEDASQKGLEKVVDVSMSNYAHHVDWFLKHRDHAITQLGALITAEFAMAKIADPHRPWFNAFTFFVMAMVGGCFGMVGIMGCRRSFQHALESMATGNKALWALGLSGQIKVDRIQESLKNIAPLKDDKTLSAPRWIDDMKDVATTEDFVKTRLGKKRNAFRPRNNTCFYASSAIAILSLGSLILGCLFAFGAEGTLGGK